VILDRATQIIVLEGMSQDKLERHWEGDMKAFFVMLAGVLMMLSSLAHGTLGWRSMRDALESAGAGNDLVGALAAGWYFGSVAMAVFGAIVITSGLRLRRGDLSGVLPVRLIAAGYVLFGLGAFFGRNLNPHFLLFVLTGLLAGIPVLRTPPQGGASSGR
jgi:hypothetical protein